MLINTISFQIVDVKNQINETYLVPATQDMEDRIFTHKHTRSIEYTRTMDIEYGRKVRVPFDFIDMPTWYLLYSSRPELFDAAVAEQNELVAA